MKIALPSRENLIDDHFGHCEYFTIFTVDGKHITNQETLPSATGCGCKSGIATTLAEMGVSVLLAGNMGDGAVNVLQQAGINVIRGCSGDLHEVTQKWLNGSITDSKVVCHEHDCHE